MYIEDNTLLRVSQLRQMNRVREGLGYVYMYM